MFSDIQEGMECKKMRTVMLVEICLGEAHARARLTQVLKVQANK